MTREDGFILKKHLSADFRIDLVSIFVFGKQYTDKQATVSDGIVTLTF